MRDLGKIEAEHILIFGGPYGNLEVTQTILKKAKALNIAREHIICTGDIAAYCADPQAVAKLLGESGVHSIQGNCEQALAQDLDNCGCGFDEGSACDILAKHWFSYCQNNISQDTRNWFKTLPTDIRFSYGGRSFKVIHGGVEDTSKLIFESESDDVFLSEFEVSDTDCIIAGHCGLPFTKQVGDKVWHNSGVIGMPANDGTPRAWYSLISIKSGAITFEHRALNYDAQKAKNKMMAEKLPQAYANALTSGLWPSLDILPFPERRQTGQKLSEKIFEWK